MKRSFLCFALCFLMLYPLAHAGSNAVSLRVLDMEGERYAFSSILQGGRNIALVFWQPWCASCKKEAPQIEEAVQAHAGKIQFFGVVSGPDEFVDDDKVSAFTKKYELTYPQIRDRKLELTDAFKVNSTPTIVILGASGNVLYEGHHAPDEWEAFAGIQVGASTEGR